ncbi:transcriptional regulator [Haloferax mediterranei ATCC 33500]|uniref:Transcription regulator n=1 Tax=Haloferax mediterranei (strain ATCC 33500 / DSM 1411 / JCM 8866 / NBRC 14739 / NCIMB 2177 / R-4) TaxID=523841 RepID=I3R373_HALMT|nr:helix-turn-helix domain-containing protein [Haloferax mediterranei]AFK18683.1 transcription regulator [Haloferax mediterranei ATCC 33500]AHZ21947.1 transcriptional regulator [Haloferax mediterranei ATCC 33500]EMA03456.1 transcriptional regulator [Haloferax mediterranei ATCC 33500]MDX5988780.1 helix-turn-helix domain-containing protein [Haloferax mediterranei ATCC 33500]QCQ75183.1 transcriptional regulator [Haloferax mediterranei ATCC 33500]
MKSVGLRLTPDENHLHPMHEFVVEHEAFERTKLHHWNPTMTETNTIVFEVVGSDIEAYEEALTSIPTILSSEVAQMPGDSFFIVVKERLDAAGVQQTTAFTQDGLVVVPPVIFEGDGTILVTIVGTDEALQSAVDQTPEGIDIEIRRVREYTGPGDFAPASLSPRQREAVEAAVACGYYRESRDGSVAAVAEQLGCSTGTAAEHLRKAEMKVMSAVVDGQ